MATSGSYDVGQTGTQLIQAVYEDLGVVIPGGTISSARSTLALDRLNKIMKQYQGNLGSQGTYIHTRQRVTLLLAKGQQSYLIGPASTDARASTLMGRTTVATAYVSGTSLVVTSNTDTTTYPGTTIAMANSDIIGVQLNNGTIEYTTISSIAGAPTITLAGGLASAAAAGNYVYWFTSRAQRFPVLEAATLRNSDYTETPIKIYSEVREYDLGVTDKYGDGTPTALLFEPLRLNSRITFNSQPTDVTQQVNLTVLYPQEDMDAAANDLSCPQEAYRFLHWELAFALSPIFRWTPQMEANRNEARALYLGLNPENSVAYFQVGGL